MGRTGGHVAIQWCADQLSGVAGWNGAAVEVALREFATKGDEMPGLIWGLDALCDDLQVQGPSQADDGGGQVGLASPVGEGADEAAVDLELVDGQLVDMT